MDVFESLLHKTFFSFFLGGLFSLLVITNPLTKIPLFLSLTSGMDAESKNTQARKACMYAFAILIVSLFAGVLILGGFGIFYNALRIAGGLTIAVVGYRMLFQEARPQTADAHGRHDIAFFPLAMPGISGPGA